MTDSLSRQTSDTLTYTYDAAGRRTALTGTWARTGLPAAAASASYNANNQQTAWGAQINTFDLNGNLTSDGTNTYTWDARDRLASISGGTTASLTYDPTGRRASKAIAGTTTQFLYDGANPVQELSGAGAVLANLLTGLGIDEYFTRTDGSGRRTLLADALGSILALSDDAGTVQTSYTYEPFGATTQTGQANSNSFQYTGRENDGTGLYYNRARYLYPASQRFASEDPLRFSAGSANTYLYALDNPVSASDPTGLSNVPCSFLANLTLSRPSSMRFPLGGRKDTLLRYVSAQGLPEPLCRPDLDPSCKELCPDCEERVADGACILFYQNKHWGGNPPGQNYTRCTYLCLSGPSTQSRYLKCTLVIET